MTALYVIGAWLAIATVLTVGWCRIGFLRKQIRKMQLVSKLRDDARSDGLESLGFSQGVHSLHNGGIAL